MGTGSCISTTDCNSGTICFGLSYTPATTGTLTSYTFGFLGSCTGSIPTITNSSCTMVNSSSIIDGCAQVSLYRLVASGNSGNVPVTAGVPIILHQVCIDLGLGGTSDLEVDPVTTLTTSIDAVSGPVTEFPTFANFTADDSECTTTPDCENTTICSVDFGTTAGQLAFATNTNGNINDAISLANSEEVVQSFDVYDENNEDCTQPGGMNDLTIKTLLFNTDDLNDNGIIDMLAGNNHQIDQLADGLTGSLPFGAGPQSETSAGDVRGYQITVEFASHIGIRAENLTVNLSGLNSPGIVFESASLSFLDPGYVPYSSPAYIGYFNGLNDLSGDCLPTAVGTPWSTPAAGAVVYAATGTVDLTDPCLPVTGSGGSDGNLTVNAATDAGLAPMAFVRGFNLRVFGEDIAAPNVRDDGSGLDGDDGTVGNHPTVSTLTLVSSLLGYTVDGCVFEDIALPVEWLAFAARARDKQADLTWRTAEEINHDRFTVEWSTDGRQFAALGEIREPAEVSSQNENTYHFLHERPLTGTNYYRIRQHDFDGTTSLSEVRRLTFGEEQTAAYELFPNPATDQLTIRLTQANNTPFVGQLLTATGRLVRNFSLVPEPEYGEVQLAIDDLPMGVYLVRIGESSLRFVKSKTR